MDAEIVELESLHHEFQDTVRTLSRRGAVILEARIIDNIRKAVKNNINNLKGSPAYPFSADVRVLPEDFPSGTGLVDKLRKAGFEVTTPDDVCKWYIIRPRP